MYFRMTNEFGRRERWTVKVAASKLIACCDERTAYHKGRVEFWDRERVKAEESLRKDGIQLRHLPVSGGKRMEAQLDAGLAKRVGECEERQKHHKDSVNRFHAFRAMFRLAGSEELDLNADDVLYFNLEGADAGGDDQPQADY